MELGLHLLPKLSHDHINLTSFSVMNVKLAAQVLSSTVAKVLLQYGPPEAAGTAKFCEMIDYFFDRLNVSNTTEYKTKQKPFLKPYTDINDDRFTWLIDVFLRYFADWKQSTVNRPGKFDDTAHSNMFISHQTYEGLQITSMSIVELLSSGVPYALTERFCQAPLEKYFGRQTAINGRKDNPSLRDFGYGDNAIRNSRSTTSIMGNVSGSGHGIDVNNIDDACVPCRKRKATQALT